MDGRVLCFSFELNFLFFIILIHGGFSRLIKLNPKGIGRGLGTHLSVTLSLYEPAFQIYAQFCLRILNQRDDKKHEFFEGITILSVASSCNPMYKVFLIIIYFYFFCCVRNIFLSFFTSDKDWFSAPSYGWCFYKFTSLAELAKPESGFLVDDTLIVEAEVTVLGVSNILSWCLYEESLKYHFQTMLVFIFSVALFSIRKCWWYWTYSFLLLIFILILELFFPLYFNYCWYFNFCSKLLIWGFRKELGYTQIYVFG